MVFTHLLLRRTLVHNGYMAACAEYINKSTRVRRKQSIIVPIQPGK